jgi:hypothetical protein
MAAQPTSQELKMGEIDPPGVIAARLVLMILLGIVVPQIAGLLVHRASARRPDIAQGLGAVVPSVVIAGVLFMTTQLQRASQTGTRAGCGTPIAAVLLVLVPGHAVLAEYLQSRLRGRTGGK